MKINVQVPLNNILANCKNFTYIGTVRVVGCNSKKIRFMNVFKKNNKNSFEIYAIEYKIYPTECLDWMSDISLNITYPKIYNYISLWNIEVEKT